jgi:hypothetical protein
MQLLNKEWNEATWVDWEGSGGILVQETVPEFDLRLLPSVMKPDYTLEPRTRFSQVQVAAFHMGFMQFCSTIINASIHRFLCRPSLFTAYLFVWLLEIIKLYKNVKVFRIQMNPLKPSGHHMYHQFNIHKSNILPTQCTYVFSVDLRNNSYYFPIQHYMTGFCNRDLTL